MFKGALGVTKDTIRFSNAVKGTARSCVGFATPRLQKLLVEFNRLLNHFSGKNASARSPQALCPILRQVAINFDCFGPHLPSGANLICIYVVKVSKLAVKVRNCNVERPFLVPELSSVEYNAPSSKREIALWTPFSNSVASSCAVFGSIPQEY